MSKKISIIAGKGDWEATPPTGASDHDLYHILNDFFEDGGVLDLEGDDFKVVESASPDMKVTVKKGTVFVPNSSWSDDSLEPKFYRIVSDSDEEDIPIANNASGQIRTDLICQSVDKITEPNDDASNVCPIVVVEGDPGSGAPAIPDDMEVLAEIEVADGASTISDAEITDRRRQFFARPVMTNSRFKVLDDAVTISIDSERGKYNKFYATIEGNRDITITDAIEGVPIWILIQNSNGGGHTPNFTNTIKWSPGGDEPIWTTDEDAIDGVILTKLPNGDFIGSVTQEAAQ